MIQTEDSVEILEVPGQAEGESGSETIGFSTFGSQRVNDAQKRRGRPTSTRFKFNGTANAAQATFPQPPPAYWGNFITLFDGTIVAGTRLDGVGINWATGTIPANPIQSCWSDGSGTRTTPTTGVQLPALYTSNVIGAKGGLIGLDVFFRTSLTNFNCAVSYVPATGATMGVSVVTNKVPNIGVLVPGIVVTRRRPEGYIAGEDGVQVFIAPPSASTFAVAPAGFVDPSLVGVPNFALVNDGFNSIGTGITP